MLKFILPFLVSVLVAEFARADKYALILSPNAYDSFFMFANQKAYRDLLELGFKKENITAIVGHDKGMKHMQKAMDEVRVKYPDFHKGLQYTSDFDGDGCSDLLNVKSGDFLKSAILQTLSRLADTLKNEDELFILSLSHGFYQYPSEPGNKLGEFLLSTLTKDHGGIDSRYEHISTKEMKPIFSKMKANVYILSSNCCGSAWNCLLSCKKNVFVISATSEKELSFLEWQKHLLFDPSYLILEALKSDKSLLHQSYWLQDRTTFSTASYKDRFNGFHDTLLFLMEQENKSLSLLLDENFFKGELSPGFCDAAGSVFNVQALNGFQEKIAAGVKSYPVFIQELNLDSTRKKYFTKELYDRVYFSQKNSGINFDRPQAMARNYCAPFLEMALILYGSDELFNSYRYYRDLADRAFVK